MTPAASPVSNLTWLHGLGMELRPGRKFDLAAITLLLASLGEPQRRFECVHIAGTNGKGSTAAMIESAARAAGIRTGLYTSPHLERITERVVLSGEEISPTAFEAAAAPVRESVERLLATGAMAQPPGFFEVVTAAGFMAFAEAGIELGVIEVGLGGRLDATNVVRPRVAVITPIGFDHEQFLGSTIAAIAGEKAGILKPGIQAAVTAPQAPEALAVLRVRARACGVPLVEIGPADIAAAPPTALRGRHQAENAAVAARACSALGLPEAAIAVGLASVRWPGRLERLAPRRESDPEIFLDGAHNPLAARALAAFLDDFSIAHPRPILVYGSMRDKAIEEICELLLPRAQAVVVTAPRQPRALDPATLARACAPWARQVMTAADYPAALAAALALSRSLRRDGPPPAIFVTGSLYLVGEARAHGLPAD